jgi:hypothetical protein
MVGYAIVQVPMKLNLLALRYKHIYIPSCNGLAEERKIAQVWLCIANSQSVTLSVCLLQLGRIITNIKNIL